MASSGTTSGLWIDGIGLALVVWLLLRAVPSLTYALGATGGIGAWHPSPVETAAAWVLPVLALTMTTRWPAAAAVTTAGIATVVLRFRDGPFDPFGHQLTAVALLQALAITGLAWWLARRGDGRRVMAPATAALLLTALVGSGYLAGGPDAAAPYAIVLFGLPVVGLVLVAFDPRAAIAATTVWSLLVITLIPTRLVVLPLDRSTLVLALVTVSVVAGGAQLSRHGARRLTA